MRAAYNEPAWIGDAAIPVNRRRAAVTALTLALAGFLTACAGANLYTGGDVGARPQHFSELRLGGRTAQADAEPSVSPAHEAEAAAPPARPAMVAPVKHTQVARVEVPASSPPVGQYASTAPAPASVADARRRLEAFLAARGFQFEDGASGPAEVLTATRMMDGATQAGEAACAVKALHRPAMSSTTLVVRLAPAAAGVDLGVQARFVEMDAGVVSGVLSKRVCRSRGVLEAEVRRAASGG